MHGQQNVKKKMVRVLFSSWQSVGPPDDGLQICPKHAEVDWRNKL